MRALVIEGGSMRAAYANGVLAAFEDADHRSFDAVYGTSAGGALAAWWSAKQANYAIGTWKYAEDRRVLSYRRWITGRGPLLDHDTLFSVVYEKERPLNVDAVMAAPHPVVVSVTDAETGATDHVDIRRGPVLAWLRATGRMPIAAGEAVEIGGRKWVDGGVTDPIPVQRALDDGATEVVLILNRPAGERKPEGPLVARIVAAKYPHLRKHVEAHHATHNAAVRLAEHPPPGVRIDIIRPARDPGVRRFTRDTAVILRAIERGRADGQAYLAKESGLVIETP